MEILETFPWMFCFPTSHINENGGKFSKIVFPVWNFMQSPEYFVLCTKTISVSRCKSLKLTFSIKNWVAQTEGGNPQSVFHRNCLKYTARIREVNLTETVLYFKCLWNEIFGGLFERPFKIQKNGVFLFEISFFVLEILTFFYYAN